MQGISGHMAANHCRPFLDNGPEFSLPEIGVEPNVSEVMGLASKPFLSPGARNLFAILSAVNTKLTDDSRK